MSSDKTEKTGKNEDIQNKEQIQTQTNNKKKLNKGPYLLGEALGEGAFAKVRLATQIHIKEKCAIKIVDKRLLENIQDIQRLRKEIKILKKIRHKNIIQLYDIMESKTNLYFVMEYCKGGELFDYIVKKTKLTEKEACIFFHQIINGIEYLHNQGIIHRDLKPENLLLDDKNQIKISDFGLSTFFTKDNFLQTACGTPSYAPPEMLEGLQYDGEASDIWSCGIILYAMLCGALPFTESKEEIIIEKIKRHEYRIPDYLSKEAQDMLNNILKINPQERFNIESIKKHPWFNLVEPHLIKGLSVDNIKIPVDEKILNIVKDYGFNPDECRELLLKNKFCSLTSIYYLCLKKYVKEGGKSISDLESDLFEKYINDPNNYINNTNKDETKETNEKNIDNNGNNNDKSNNDSTNNNSNNNTYKKNNEDETNEAKESNDLKKDKDNKNNNEIKKDIESNKKDKANINSKSNEIIIIKKFLKPNSYSTDKKSINNKNTNDNDKILFEKYKEKELSKIKSEENNYINDKSTNKAKKETSLRNNKIGSNQKMFENNKLVNIKDKKFIKKNSQKKETSVKDENNKDGKKQNKKNRNNISLHNIQNKIFSYENHNIAKKLNQNEFSYKTINDISNNKNNNKFNENNASKNKKEINKKNNNYLSPNKKVYIKKFDKKFNKNLNNAIIISENLCDKTFSHNNENNINTNLHDDMINQNNNNNNKKEGNTEKKHKSLPFEIEDFMLNKDDNITMLETEKPLNVINYIAKKLVTSSFCGNLNLEFNKNNMTKRNNEIYDKQTIGSNINLLTNKENNKEQNNKIENNKSVDNHNHNLFNNDGNFKNLISVLNQKFKNYLSKENSKNGNQHTQKNRSMKNNKYILNNLEYNNYFINDMKKINELTPTQKNVCQNKIDFLSNNTNTNIDSYSYSYCYNINNMTSHYNNYLDISTNYDPGIDSKGESSLDKLLSINKNELRNYSISLDKKKNENNMNIINLDCLRNNGGVSNSHNKYSKNMNVISEDDELNEFSKDKESNNIKCFKNKNKNSLTDKKISINLTTTFKPLINTDMKKK